MPFSSRSALAAFLTASALLVPLSCDDAAEPDSDSTDLSDLSDGSSDDSSAVDEAGDGEDGDSDEAEPDDGETGGEPPSAPVLTLLDPGMAPLEVRAYTVEAGTEERVRMTFVQEIRQTADGEEMPGIDMTYSVEGPVTVESTDGDSIVVTQVFEEVDAPDAEPTVAAGLEVMEGTTLRTVFGPDGRVLSADVEGGMADMPGMEQMTEEISRNTSRLTVPLPSEPIGVGASWTVDEQLQLMGLEVQQMSTYELLAVNPDGSMEISTSVTQTVDGGSMVVPGMTDDMSFEVLRWESSGGGTTTVSPLHLNPVLAEVVVDAQQTFAASLSGEEGELVQVLHMEQTIEIVD